MKVRSKMLADYIIVRRAEIEGLEKQGKENYQEIKVLHKNIRAFCHHPKVIEIYLNDKKKLKYILRGYVCVICGKKFDVNNKPKNSEIYKLEEPEIIEYGDRWECDL